MLPTEDVGLMIASTLDHELPQDGDGGFLSEDVVVVQRPVLRVKRHGRTPGR